jgi:diguanylate cyclase (GGDEF)-like protein
VAGDSVLRDTAALLRNSQQGKGVLGRLGGEEFVTVLPRCDVAAALALAERGRAAVAAHEFRFSMAGGTQVLHRQTLSAGIGLFEPGMLEPPEMLAAADRNLYASKHAGRNRVTA